MHSSFDHLRTIRPARLSQDMAARISLNMMY